MEQTQCYHIVSILGISEVPPCLPVSVLLPKKFHKKNIFSDIYLPGGDEDYSSAIHH